MILKGTVRNVIDFGAFVDIGVHQDGLVHISQICNRFIKQVVVFPVNVALLLLMLRGVQRMPNAVTHL